MQRCSKYPLHSQINLLKITFINLLKITIMYDFKTSQALQIANNLLSNVRNGASINFLGESPKSGFMVSFQGQGLEFDNISSVNAHAIAAWVNERHAANSDAYFGIWRDSETSRVYVDVSLNISDINLAKEFGRIQEQIAIWDVKNNKEIRL